MNGHSEILIIMGRGKVTQLKNNIKPNRGKDWEEEGTVSKVPLPQEACTPSI